jgi:nitrite reductase/ring-hydroxylating ferredoxin subunit
VGASHKFQLANGAPALLFRTKAGVFAYQTICTHQGGEVSYLAAGKLMVCGVHNASFDPFASGKVVKGPTGSAASTISPLPSVKVKVAGAWIVLS